MATAVGNSSGANVSFVLKNKLLYSTLNSNLMPKDGNYINYINFLETPTSSSNGSIKNIVMYKNFNSFNRNIFSFQSKIEILLH